MDIRCVHGDVHRNPVELVEIRHEGEKHRIKAVVSSSLVHPLILGTNWPGFNRLVGQWVGLRSRPVGTWEVVSRCGGGTGGVFSGDSAGSRVSLHLSSLVMILYALPLTK